MLGRARFVHGEHKSSKVFDCLRNVLFRPGFTVRDDTFHAFSHLILTHRYDLIYSQHSHPDSLQSVKMDGKSANSGLDLHSFAHGTSDLI